MRSLWVLCLFAALLSGCWGTAVPMCQYPNPRWPTPAEVAGAQQQLDACMRENPLFPGYCAGIARWLTHLLEESKRPVYIMPCPPLPPPVLPDPAYYR